MLLKLEVFDKKLQEMFRTKQNRFKTHHHRSFFAKMAPSHLVEDTLQPIADHILHLQAHGSQPTIFYMGVSKNRGTPKWMVYIIMENPIKMDDLGVPLFSERSIYMRWSILAITGTGHGPLAHPSEVFIGIPQPLPLG